jgi:hypothetical protein
MKVNFYYQYLNKLIFKQRKNIDHQKSIQDIIIFTPPNTPYSYNIYFNPLFNTPPETKTGNREVNKG